jgi:hypothetical protein
MASRSACAVFLAFSAVIGVARNASATTITLFPDDDRRGIDAFLSGNFVLQADMGTATVTRTMSQEERAAMEFALAPIPAGSTILSATLKLFLTVMPAVVPQTAEVHGYVGDGVVSATDLPTTNFLTSFNVNALSVSTPIPVAYLQTLLDGGDSFFGLVLRNVTMPSGVFEIWTMDSGFEDRFPRLEVEIDTVVPEPASIILLGSALLLGRRRLGACRAAS